jgi:hypothetical protein
MVKMVLSKGGLLRSSHEDVLCGKMRQEKECEDIPRHARMRQKAIQRLSGLWACRQEDQIKKASEISLDS